MLKALWNLRYVLGRTPWDTGVTPPELVELVEGGDVRPGRALDIGCGTGTNAVYLARSGFDVVGIDSAWLAIRRARRRARRAGVEARFYTGDILRMGEAGGADPRGPFDLALDIGCFHGLGASDRAVYSAMLARAVRPGGSFLLYARSLPGRSGREVGIAPDDVGLLLGEAFHRRWAREGEERGVPSFWYRFERRGG